METDFDDFFQCGMLHTNWSATCRGPTLMVETTCVLKHKVRYNKLKYNNQ